MNSGRSDASTSTDDVKSRPLCLFYFTHPFGVLSPEPPTLAPAPPHIARAFVNMEPVAPFMWGSPATDTSYNTNTTTDSRPAYELGETAVHRAPVSLLSVARARQCTLELGPRRDSLSSSLFSGDAWFGSTSSCRSTDYPRRLVPYNKILPPLRLPSPRDSANLDSSDDFWPKKCINPEKFSLPPIELPTPAVRHVRIVRSRRCRADDSAGRRRRLGVRKPRRAPPRQADLRRAIARLMRRALGGGGCRGHVSPALRDALNTIREAWAEPRLLINSRVLSGACVDCITDVPAERPPSPRAPHAMAERAPVAALSPRAGASPGLLRRRYSVPETIMRKYRLAQQRSDTDEESAPATNRSATSASPSACEAVHRFARRDRELMRKSALMRRLWGRPDCRGCCCCGETRSLDGSRTELRGGPRGSPPGWASPKRQRLDAARDLRGSDEMLRAAMRNSFDRAARADLSDSTYRSHRREPESYLETTTDVFTDSDGSKPYDGGGRDPSPPYRDRRRSSESPTVELKSTTAEETVSGGDVSSVFGQSAYVDERSSDVSDAPSPPTTQEVQADRGLLSVSSHIDGHISEHSGSIDNDDDNVLSYDRPLHIDPPSYDVLEIVVSESLSYDSVPVSDTDGSNRPAPFGRPPHLFNQKNVQNINIDEYVSNILVESLNSLTDQLECMNASFGSDRKMSIVEKEIKVKLQNTGVNTIVHLSPTSNNQIIFGNEELCNGGAERDRCNNPNEPLSIRDEPYSVESNNNVAEEPRCSCDALHHEHVNRAVLQQIQKLFHDELHSRPPDPRAAPPVLPEITHVEVSNVDVFLDSHEAALEAERRAELIGGVGAGNYFPDVDDNPVVPRFSAFPHTDSMEVNTSSSEDADLGGSDCTSLVDSLDDPNSPRVALLRRSLGRSAIDVLDLLPETVREHDASPPRDKGEAFFIKIKDNECECDKENVNVADHMPEKIRQRLYRRQRKRELRMECARRSRGKSARDAERARRAQHARNAERDCSSILDALVDDVIAKVAQDEYKCLRIKRRPAKMSASKSDENVAKRTWKKDLEPLDDREAYGSSKMDHIRGSPPRAERERREPSHVRGKLSLLTRPPLAPDDRAAKRIYQKSEIHDGNKCIEILEILEYVNGSQSSPETATSDENQNHSLKNKKSRIPIPITERNQRSPNSDSYKNNSRRGSMERNGNTRDMIADMLARALGSPQVGPPAAPYATAESHLPAPPPPRRASVPHEPRSRSNSLRFKQVFDIIPEERSSLSLESGAEDLNHNRRASAPDIVDEFRETTDAECDAAPTACLAPGPPTPASPTVLRADPAAPRVDPLKLRLTAEAAVSTRSNRDMKSAATSPMSDGDGKRTIRSKNQTTMTSPSSKSAATSPLRGGGGAAGGRAGLARRSHDEGSKERIVELEKGPSARSGAVPAEREGRAARPPRPAPRRPRLPPPDTDSASPPDALRENDAPKQKDRRNSRIFSRDKSEEEAVKLPDFKGGGGSGAASSSDSSESGGSLLCSLAPKWLSHGRARRARRPPPAPATPPPQRAQEPPHQPDSHAPGGWSVTVAGSCRAALPADVEMRLRFPHDRDPDAPCQECSCRHCAACQCGARGPARGELPPAPLQPHLTRTDSSKVTLTMKKEALDSSILASKSSKKSSEQLPDVETYRASRSKLKSSVKTRRGYSLHCWLPENEAAPIRANDGLSVLGCAIIPELKPRVPTMSERDLTRVYTPRHYLRS